MKRLAGILVLAASLAVLVAAAAHANVGFICTPQNCGTWQPGPVHIDWSSSDGGDVSGCQDMVNVDSAGPSGTTVTCDDGDGPVPATVFVDGTPPEITSATLDRPPDQNGWYNHPVTLQLTENDALSGNAGCTSPVYSGPDGAAAQANGSCTDVAGNSAIGGVPLAYDASPPEVTASPDRPPDHNGWYNHPVSFAFHGIDSASGTASCTNASYGGPNNSSATVSGTCTDVAGNTGGGSATFRYDSTRPSPATLQVTPGNHRVRLAWTLPSDASSVLVARSILGSKDPAKLIYSGSHRSLVDKKLHNNRKYVYTVADIDQAGNSNSTSIRGIPTGSSLRPFVGSVVSSPPLLTWKRIKHARYYNVQLYLGKKKVWSTWPSKPQLQLKPNWHYKGKTITLASGHYRWYVWPGFGSRSAHSYGDRIGRSSFRVR